MEVVVRVQDTRPFAPRFDIYYGGMTDVAYTVTVIDSTNGVGRPYTNRAGTRRGPRVVLHELRHHLRRSALQSKRNAAHE